MWTNTRSAQVELSANGEKQNRYKSLVINHVLNSKELSQGRAFSTETSTTDRFQVLPLSGQSHISPPCSVLVKSNMLSHDFCLVQP
jgi:hypothetical protein